MSENKIKAFEEKVEKLESNIDSNRGQINANLEAIHWIRKLILKHNKQKIFFWQLKKEITSLKEWNEKAKKTLGRVLSKLFKKVFTLNRNALINTRITKEEIENSTKAFLNILDDSKLDREVLQNHLESHIRVARDQLTDKDRMTIFKEFDQDIENQLKKLDAKDDIKVTISRNDGEKGENSKDVISSKENNLSTPERRKDGKTPSKSCETCDYKNNDQDNHPCNDCGVLRLHWKPKKATPLKCEKCKFLISNINKYGAFYCWELDMKMFALPSECLHFKEPTDDKKLMETAKTTEIILVFDNGHEHVLEPEKYKVVSVADLECYKKELKEIKKKVKYLIKDGAREWFQETLACLIQNVEKYLKEKEDGK